MLLPPADGVWLCQYDDLWIRMLHKSRRATRIDVKIILQVPPHTKAQLQQQLSAALLLPPKKCWLLLPIIFIASTEIITSQYSTGTLSQFRRR